MIISGCGADYLPEAVPSVFVQRTYEKIEPSPAVTAVSYDLRLKIDTEQDRLTQTVSMNIKNETDGPVDEALERYKR